MLLEVVPKLPTAKQIRGLTSKTVRMVADAYLGKLKRGQKDENAVDFAKATIDHFEFLSQHYREECKTYSSAVGQLLRLVPHCRVSIEKDLESITANPLFLDWCEFSEVKFELIHLDRDAIYVFENEEDRILFKLRWL